MIRFEKIRPEHVDAVIEIIRRHTWATYCRDEPWEVVLARFRELNTCEDVRNVQAEYFDAKGTFLVVLDGDRVVGAGAVQKLNEDACDLVRFYLRPEYQNQGIGAKLLVRLLDFARQAGYSKVETSTYKESERALHLFKKHGFRLVKTYGDGDKEFDDSPDYTLEKLLA